MESNNLLQQFKWYWQRLKCMSLSEVNFRFRQAIRKRLMQKDLLVAGTVPQPDINYRERLWIDYPLKINSKGYIKASESIISKGFQFFELEKSIDMVMDNWNRDLKTGTPAPLEFGLSLNYKDQFKVGDIKYLWEPNRHLFLVPIAQGYRLSGDERYLNKLAELLQSWISQCPYLKGPNWTSSLELGIRLINWSIVWQLIGGLECPIFKDHEGLRLRDDLLSMIYRQAHLIRHNFSRYSSGNNHLIGEAAGLYTACLTWPFWKDFSDWQADSYKILIEEIVRQNSDDGVNLEQAISYQQFVLDFFIIAGLAGRANNINFPDTYWKRIEVMIAYIGSMMDTAGNLPMIGDADDGYVVHLSPEEDFCPYKSLLATGAVLFNRADFKAKAGKIDQKTIWLLGGNAADLYDSIKVDEGAATVQQSFPKGGYYLMGVNFNTPQEIKCIIDCGPLGYLSIAAHGHADALSIFLSVNGNEIMIDPGTFAYHTQASWRNYFRGTSAHNTVRIDGSDQSEISGNFMWASKAHALCRLFEIGNSRDRFIGYHDGYQRLKDPVIHEREITFDKQCLELMVSDRLTCRSQHQVERFFHFSEQCRVDLVHDGLRILNKDTLVEVRPMEPDCQIERHIGNETLPMGWTSRHYDQKTPSPSAVFRNNITGSACLQTSIQIHPNVSK